MSRYFLSLFAVLFLATLISCSSAVFRNDDVSSDQTDRYLRMTDSDEENVRRMMPTLLSFLRDDRSPMHFPRVNRNAWYRVSTYQHLHPPIAEETNTGNHVMRWGR